MENKDSTDVDLTNGPPVSQDRILQACSVGDIATLEVSLSPVRQNPFPDRDEWISSMMAAAVSNNQTGVLRWLLARYPHFPEQEHWLSPVHDRFFSLPVRLELYEVLIERYPFLEHWDYGEIGDHLGAAAAKGDLEFVKYLLDHGADARQARYRSKPVLNALACFKSSDKNMAQIKQLLKDHGATNRFLD